MPTNYDQLTGIRFIGVLVGVQEECLHAVLLLDLLLGGFDRELEEIVVVHGVVWLCGCVVVWLCGARPTKSKREWEWEWVRGVWIRDME